METHAYLIRPIRFAQISHPFHTIIPALLKHLEIPHEQARGCKHDHCRCQLLHEQRHLSALCGSLIPNRRTGAAGKETGQVKAYLKSLARSVAATKPVVLW